MTAPSRPTPAQLQVAEAATWGSKPTAPTEYRVTFTPWRNEAGDALGIVDPIETQSYTLHGCKLKRGPKGRLWIALPSIQELVDGKLAWRTVLVLHGEVRERFQEGVLAALRRQCPELFTQTQA